MLIPSSDESGPRLLSIPLRAAMGVLYFGNMDSLVSKFPKNRLYEAKLSYEVAQHDF